MRSPVWLIAAGLFLSFAATSITTPAFGEPAAETKRRVVKRVAGKPAGAKRSVMRPRAQRRFARGKSPYGFLPGYRPPYVIARQDRWRARNRPYYALPIATFHRGRWNGGGFGPCYTYTPIGPIWNCGR